MPGGKSSALQTRVARMALNHWRLRSWTSRRRCPVRTGGFRGRAIPTCPVAIRTGDRAGARTLALRAEALWQQGSDTAASRRAELARSTGGGKFKTWSGSSSGGRGLILGLVAVAGSVLLVSQHIDTRRQRRRALPGIRGGEVRLQGRSAHRARQPWQFLRANTVRPSTPTSVPITQPPRVRSLGRPHRPIQPAVLAVAHEGGGRDHRPQRQPHGSRGPAAHR